jgi:archaetidylinositol phosphate synthase
MLWKRRKHLDKTGRKIGKIFSKIPLSPNKWTGMGLVLAIITFCFLVRHEFLLATVVFAFTAAIDMIDGAVAKVTKKVTRLGGFLDSYTDRAVEFVTILGLFLAGFPDVVISIETWLMLLFFGSFMSTYARAVSFEKKIRRNVKGGVLEHADRMLVFFFIILISNFSLQLASYLIVLTAVLSLLSALQRFLKATKR